MSKINLSSEYIFYTIQGEGKYAGHPSVFLRTSQCNLRCSWINEDGSTTQCDTPHTSFNPEINMYEVEEIAQKAVSYDCPHIVITGGEPYIQKSFVELINLIKLKNPESVITIETNGTFYKPSRADFISISPKLSTSSMDPTYGEAHEKKRLNYETLTDIILHHDYQLKFVINTQEDVLEVLEIVRTLAKMTKLPINDKVWVMPQGTDEAQLQSKMKWLWNICKEYKWKYTDRLHVRCYGHMKGV